MTIDFKYMGRILPVLIVYLMLFTSCDIYSEYAYVIRNETSDTVSITFQGRDATFFELDTLEILPTTDTIFFRREDNRVKELICDPYFEEVVGVGTSSSRMLVKEIKSEGHWECDAENDFANWYLRFTIRESDLK